MATYNERFNYFEDDTLASEWFNSLCRNIAWEAFERQEEWCVSASERENRKPLIKNNFVEVFDEIFDQRLAFLRETILLGFLCEYYNDDIEVMQDVADWYNAAYDYDKSDAEYMEGTELEGRAC